MKFKIIAALALINLAFFVTTVSADTYLFGYTPGGALGGGIRFDLKPGMVLDLSASGGNGITGSTYNLYGDVFIGNWGVGVLTKKTTVNSNLAFEISLQYAVEQAINNKVSAGVLLLLLNHDTAAGADPNNTLLPTIAPYFVLAL